MKKVLLICIILILLVALIFGIRFFKKTEVSNIDGIINSNSKLPVEYLSKYNKNNTFNGKYDVTDNYMSVDYSNDDIEFSYYGYPDDESDYRLGSITLLNSKYNILGVTVGDNLKKSINKIEKYGFELEDSNNYMIATLKYSDISIIIESDYSGTKEDDDSLIIQQIKITANSKYLGDIWY